MQGTEFLDPGVQIPIDGLGALGIVGHHGPAHPKLVTFQSRLITFNLWPPGLRQKPEELARSGFFYEGRSDQVRCFSCDGGLSSWEEEDSPAKEHAKWFSRCTFLNLTSDHRAFSKTISIDSGYSNEDEELREKVQQLKDERSCKICLAKEV